jgi:hypothetical protein
VKARLEKKLLLINAKRCFKKVPKENSKRRKTSILDKEKFRNMKALKEE